MTEIVVALTTVPADFDVLALARELIGWHAAACVTVLPPVQSVYEWDGVVTVDREQQLLIKTTQGKVEELWQMLRARHPHQVPEFLVIPVLEGNPVYLKWIEERVVS